jgi:hypothetical protein
MTIRFSFDKRPNMNAACMRPVPAPPQRVRRNRSGAEVFHVFSEP